MTLSPKRKARVTGSSAGAILGLDPNRTRDDVMRQMVRDWHGAEQELDQFAEDVIFAYGHQSEAGAIAEFEMVTGLVVNECGFFVHPEHDWLGATPDGLVGDYSVLEVKCPWGKRKDSPVVFKSVEEQPHYYAQMQIEMACAQRVNANFYQWAPGGDRWITVPHNPEWLAENLPALRAFYDDYLREREKPEKHLEPKRQVIESDEAQKLIAEYDDLCEALDRANERKKEVLAALVVIAKDKNSTVCGRSLSKVERVGAVSYAAVVKKHCADVDLESFRGKASEYWSLK